MGTISFKRFLEERFVNALPKDEDLKAKYADKAWELLQKSYAPIGGIKGKGFESKEDMMSGKVKNNPITAPWKHHYHHLE